MKTRAVLGILLTALTVALSLVTPQAAASPGITATRPFVGMPVCKDGRTTGRTCGTVTAVNVTVCSPQSCVTGLARATMVSAPGDQGAPVYYRTELIGFVVGASGGSTFFDPI